MIAWIKQLKRRTPLGWLQLSHSRSRLLVALSGIAFADILLFMQLGFQASLYESNTQIRRALNSDIVLVSPKAKNTQNLSTFTRRRLYQAMDIPGVISAQPLYSNNLMWKNPQNRREATIQVIGFSPDHPPFRLPEVNQQLNKIKLPDVVLFDRGSRGDYKSTIALVDAGKAIATEAEGRTIHIGGLFTLGASFGTDGILMTSDQNFLLLFPKRDVGSISLGLIDIEAGKDPDQIVEALKKHLPDDVKVMTLADFIEDEQAYWRKESPIGFIFTMGAAMAFVVGVVIVYQVLSTDVNAHLKEYATFKAMGYRHSYLLSIVFEEAIILAVLGFIPGVILPLGLYSLAAKATALPIYMTLSRAGLVLFLTLFMCLFSGAIATRKLQSADPADMF
ncbi:ABC transporter permease DevC [Pseudanabaena galeata UHCC 0370]|uniref:ABC transporter permease DevC n=1 Tax=Pseudanabaena galeata UHCC 0370 TaxID=3110310 RepID=A0ABU5TQL6_9CYAN|nr:ABC transporter permease DevC [Pseudanabaena galeata]MEA5480590.1 ABC transporter permease DevC [Pseudanabaena galeata UHCC 0370]